MFKFQNFKTHSENFQPGKTDSKIAIRTSQKQLFSFYSTIDLFLHIEVLHQCAININKI